MQLWLVALLACGCSSRARGEASREAQLRARKDGVWDTDCQATFDAIDGRTFAALDAGVFRRGDGVVFSAAGDAEFARREVLPLARTVLRLRGDAAWPAGVRVALFAEDALLPPLAGVRGAFDVVVSHDALRAAHGWYRLVPSTPPAFRVKAAKIVAMARSPFERTVYLDFDSRPCVATFAQTLFGALGDSDVALADNYAGQNRLQNDDHYRREHASGCVALASESPRTRSLLSLYLEAHVRLRKTTRGKRDQPALMVALLKSRRSAQSIDVADVGPDVFCRKNTSKVVSCDACVVAHKPARYDVGAKVFGIGVKKTATTSLAAALAALKVSPEAPHADAVAATLALLRDPPDATRAVAVAATARAFADAPWCMAASRGGLLQRLADVYPRAKFVLTVRDGDLWWRSTRNWLACLKPFNVERYTKMLGAANFSKAAFQGAFDAYNRRTVDFFHERGEAHRLLVVDLTVRGQERAASQALCEFVEAWGSCPAAISHANAYLASDFAQQHPDAAPPADALANSCADDSKKKTMQRGRERHPRGAGKTAAVDASKCLDVPEFPLGGLRAARRRRLCCPGEPPAVARRSRAREAAKTTRRGRTPRTSAFR